MKVIAQTSGGKLIIDLEQPDKQGFEIGFIYDPETDTRTSNHRLAGLSRWVKMEALKDQPKINLEKAKNSTIKD